MILPDQDLTPQISIRSLGFLRQFLMYADFEYR